MRKTSFPLAVFLIPTQILLVSAQTVDPTNTSQQSSSLIGELIATVVVVAIFSIIAYAGYRIVKRWSFSQAD